MIQGIASDFIIQTLRAELNYSWLDFSSLILALQDYDAKTKNPQTAPPTLESNRMLKPADAAKMLGICTKTLARLVRKGLLPSYRMAEGITLPSGRQIGGRICFRLSEINRYVEQHKIAPPRRQTGGNPS